MGIQVSELRDLTPTQVGLSTLVPALELTSETEVVQGPDSFSLEQLLARRRQQLPHTRDQQLLISAQHRAKQKLALTKACIRLLVPSQLRVIKGLLILHPTVNQIWTSLTSQLLSPLGSTRIHQILISLVTQFPLHPGKRVTRTTSLITQQDLISLTLRSQQDHTATSRNQLQLQLTANQLQLTANQLQLIADQFQLRVNQLFHKNQTIQLVWIS